MKCFRIWIRKLSHQ